MSARRILCCVAGAIAFGAAPPISSEIAAQTSLLSPGRRVRVTAPDHDMRGATGRVLRLTVDSLTIDRDGARPDVTLAVHAVTRIQVSTGKRHGLGFVQGAGAGFMIGTFVGIAFGALQYYSCSKEECELWFLLTVPAGAGAGLIIGSIVGAARPPDRWEDVSLPGQSRPSGMGGHGRATGIGFSISF